MRVPVLGAGAVGGYFGGRLAQAGAAEEVAFLVRPGRKAQLGRNGLVIESPSAGDWRGPVRAPLAEAVRPGWDVVLLTREAHDLAAAVEAIRPAMDGRTAVLPPLNGLSHTEALEAAFGQGRVLGGLATIQAALAPGGAVRHLAPFTHQAFGALDGRISERALALRDALARAPVEVEAMPDIRRRVWEKLVPLGTLAAATVLMRANPGEIARAPGGGAWLQRLLDRNAAIAAAHGHPVRPEAVERRMLPFIRGALPSSAGASPSMPPDLEAGGRIEAEPHPGLPAQVRAPRRRARRAARGGPCPCPGLRGPARRRQVAGGTGTYAGLTAAWPTSGPGRQGLSFVEPAVLPWGLHRGRSRAERQRARGPSRFPVRQGGQTSRPGSPRTAEPLS